MSATELEKLRQTLAKEKRKVMRSPAARKQFLIKAGIMTPAGNFKKAFRALA